MFLPLTGVLLPAMLAARGSKEGTGIGNLSLDDVLSVL
jgi:hypothetical protein